MRIGIIGGGVIARLFLEHMAHGDMGEARVVAIQGRSAASRGKPLAEQYGVPFVTSLDALIAARPEVVIEAASHDAVREFALPLLKRGIPAHSATILCASGLRPRRRNTKPFSTCLRAASAASMRSRRYAWPAPIRSRSP